MRKTTDDRLDPEKLKREVDRRMQVLRDDPVELRRYGLRGTGELDELQWEEVRRMVRLEVQTEYQRRNSPADDAESDSTGALEVLQDRYELRRELGRGAQGRTYLGYDRHRASDVAVKELLLEDVDDWKAIELFEREGDTLKHLNHDCIPDYVDTFHFADNDGKERFFLVQEYVEGTDYETLTEEGKTFTEEEAKEFLRQLLEVLVYLQDRSPPVIHRDIKPSNVMRRDGGGLALIDFGAVQSVIPNKTGGSTIIGTSGYMPVEQLMGRAVPATDLYAAGATVVHLLSRRHPADLPVERMELQFEPYINVSERFTDYLEKLLEPQVEDRFSTAEEALEALRRLDEPQRPAPAKHSATHPRKVGPQREARRSPSLGDSRGSSRESAIRAVAKGVGRVAGLFTVAAALVLGVIFVGVGSGDGAGETSGPTTQQRCEGGSVSACMEWGEDREDTAPQQAIEAFSRACRLGNLNGCDNAASLALERGEFDEAVPSLNFACDYDDTAACTSFSWLVRDDQPAAGEHAARKACDGGDADGCAHLAFYRLRHFERGEESEGEPLQEASDYAADSCESDSGYGCAVVAVARLYHQNFPRDVALEYANRAALLENNHPRVLLARGLVSSVHDDVEGAVSHLQEALEATEQPRTDAISGRDNTRTEIVDTATDRLELLEELYPQRADAIAEVRERFLDYADSA